ncbi:MAG: LysM peptidoglycan-binding domain-containing protein [Acidobacteriota bacterium]|nr:LysM peptidoglycan-binding domain-containing protein [Acidobacteriota bacterium]MDQ7088423.1 LysM peptidoglycan-binding domain-containing protein [Acidobacteriota bacterium]
MRSAPPPAAQPQVDTAQAATDVPGQEEVLAEVARLVVLARQQLRVGLLDEARESWDRAIARLAPLATRDPALTGRLRAIEAEADKMLEVAASREQRYAATAEKSAQRLEGLLDAPEPALDPSHLAEVEGAAEAVTPDYPVEVNDRVLAWLEVYRKGGKLGKWFESSLRRSGRYEQRFREIFAEEGIPQDLIYLAHVESGFKTSAYSRARARGIFQFIASTGRRYGLRVDWWIDERAEPEKSCRAAATYLRDLYAEFGDWYLALAAYNGGEGRVRRTIRRAKTRDFWAMARRRFFRRETRNYVPAILAATLISKDPARFGYTDLVKDEPLAWETVRVPAQADLEVLARAAGTEARILRELNPALRRGQTPPKYPDYELKVPPGHAAGFAEKLAAIPRDQWIVKQLHRVRRGDTLSTLARRYGTSVRAIQLANGMGRRTLLSIGRVLEIPRGPAPSRSSSRQMRADADGRYTVRRGDTLAQIARRFGVTVAHLQQWNGLGRSTRIYAGQSLRVSGSRSAAASVEPASTSGRIHVVRRGDTLWDISRRYGVSLSALMRANGLGRRSVLSPGQRLRLPPAPVQAAAARKAGNTGGGTGRVHVVRRGESLYRIAHRYGVSVDTLCRLNNIRPDQTIHPGDRLTVQ